MTAFKKPRRNRGHRYGPPAGLPDGPLESPVSISSLSPRVVELLTMLTYKRPAGSQAERAFIARYVTSLGCHLDGYGNSWLAIDSPDGTASPILWSSHTDTVHRTSGAQRIDYAYGIAMSQSGECLGADCTTGVWIMRQMIAAQVPGTYVFHLEEEVGGLGSSWVAKHAPHLLNGIQFAIAFDRKGLGDIITDQFTETASEGFARSLAAILEGGGLKYEPCDTGVFTDTANYADIVPECSNLSVGYFSAHGPMESQDIHHACRLADAMITADFSSLEVHRDPTAPTYDKWERYDPWDDNPTSSTSSGPSRRGGGLVQYVYENPDAVADFLEWHGFTVADLKQFMEGQ